MKLVCEVGGEPYTITWFISPEFHVRSIVLPDGHLMYGRRWGRMGGGNAKEYRYIPKSELPTAIKGIASELEHEHLKDLKTKHKETKEQGVQKHASAC